MTGWTWLTVIHLGGPNQSCRTTGWYHPDYRLYRNPGGSILRAKRRNVTVAVW